MHVLLVENNNLDQSESLFLSLEKQGYHVWLAHTPETATQKTATLWPNLVVFHPTHSQFDMMVFQEALNEIELNVPHIIVGNKKQLSCEISDDVLLVAPDKPQQLNQSIKKATAKQQERFLRLPALIIDCKQRNLLHSGKKHSLTPKEFKLLHLLVNNRNQVLSRKKIMQDVWETDYMGDTRTLDVHIRWIREKIEENPSRPQRLITVRGLGYRFMTNLDQE